MSIPFSDTTTKRGLVQLYEKEIGAEYGDVSDNEDRLLEYTADANVALDDFIERAIRASGIWQYDDTNHSKHPIITTDLVTGQRDYRIVFDEQGNMVLDIYRVLVMDEQGTFFEIYPTDQQTSSGTTAFTDGVNVQGVPSRYDKTGRSIFLDYPTSYDKEGGLKVYINREGSYFVSSDTSKKPGVPGILHKYFYLRPALDYARRNTLSSYDRILGEVVASERMIDRYFQGRGKDQKPLLRGRRISFK